MNPELVAADWVARTHAELGLPTDIEDPTALRRLAALILERDEVRATAARTSSSSSPSSSPGTTPASPPQEDRDPAY